MNKPGLNAKANFFRLLSVSQKAGLWVRDSLRSLQQWEKNKWLLLIIDEMIDKLTEWASLAEAMEWQSYFFNSDEIELIRSTEITWNMVQTLEEIADNLESSQEIKLQWLYYWFWYFHQLSICTEIQSSYHESLNLC